MKYSTNLFRRLKMMNGVWRVKFCEYKIELQCHWIVDEKYFCSHRNQVYENLPLHVLTEKFLCCAQNSLKVLENQHKTSDKIVVDADQMFGKFLADSISSSVFGFTDDKTHETIKQIETDLMNFDDSIKKYLTSIIPQRFVSKVLRSEINEYFKDKISREITRRKFQYGTNEVNTFIDAALSVSLNEEFVAAQIFTFFAGG